MAASTDVGMFSAMVPTTSPGVRVVRLAVPKARSVGHQLESSRPPLGKSNTSIAASDGPSSTAVKQSARRSSSPQMKVW